MGEFDLSLISEFRSRPSFYDRNSPRFKDKLYNAREWQEISNKLGFDVSILKDRILQLRNRYNLEKRRIEQLKEENPNKYYESPWPLYDHLHFLSDHIRARRSYKKLIPLNGAAEKYVVQDPSGGAGPDLSNSCSNNSNGNLNHSSEGGGGGGGDGGSANQNMTAFPNGLLAVKMEDDSDETEAETESQNNDSEVNTYYEPATVIHSAPMPQLQQNHHQQQQHHHHRQRHNSNNQQYNQRNEQQQQQLQIQHQKQQQQQQQQQHPTISIRRLDTLRSDFTNTTSAMPFNNSSSSNNNRKRSHQAMTAASSSTTFNQSSHVRQSNDDNESSISASPIIKRPKLMNDGRELKYTAFGNFLSSSLMDLPPSIALELVEKFTSDIVKALMEKAQQQE